MIWFEVDRIVPGDHARMDNNSDVQRKVFDSCGQHSGKRKHANAGKRSRTAVTMVIEESVPAPGSSAALYQGFNSGLRYQFGGHVERTAES